MMVGNLKLLRAVGKNGVIKVILTPGDFFIATLLDSERWTRTGLLGTPLTQPPLLP